MTSEQQKLNEARSRVWGHLMIRERFMDALQFAFALESLARELKDDDLVTTAHTLIGKSAAEIAEKYSKPETVEKQEHACSFCGQKPPKVRLGAGPNAFICNECVDTFSEIFKK